MRGSRARTTIMIFAFQLASAVEKLSNEQESRERLVHELARAENRIVELEQGLRECRRGLRVLLRDRVGGEAELKGWEQSEQRRVRSQKDRRSTTFSASVITLSTWPTVSRSPSDADPEVAFRPVGTSRRLLNDNHGMQAGLLSCWAVACAVACNPCTLI